MPATQPPLNDDSFAIDDDIDDYENSEYDWDAFWVEVCRVVYVDGYPATEDALVRHMMDWFAATNRAIPEQSMVERRIARLWREAARP